jgi:hypothetical protein
MCAAMASQCQSTVVPFPSNGLTNGDYARYNCPVTCSVCTTPTPPSPSNVAASPPPPPPPPSLMRVVKLVLSVASDAATFERQPFASALAVFLSISAKGVTVTDVAAGSAIVTTYLVFASHEAAAAAYSTLETASLAQLSAALDVAVLSKQVSLQSDALIDDPTLGLTDPSGGDGDGSLVPILLGVCGSVLVVGFVIWWVRYRAGSYKQSIKLLEVDTVGFTGRDGKVAGQLALTGPAAEAGRSRRGTIRNEKPQPDGRAYGETISVVAAQI